MGRPIAIDGAGNLAFDEAGQRFRVDRLEGSLGTLQAKLNRPATLRRDSGGIALADLDAMIGTGRLTGGGRIGGEQVDLRLALADAPLDVIGAFVPQADVGGIASAELRLIGQHGGADGACRRSCPRSAGRRDEDRRSPRRRQYGHGRHRRRSRRHHGAAGRWPRAGARRATEHSREFRRPTVLVQTGRRCAGIGTARRPGRSRPAAAGRRSAGRPTRRSARRRYDDRRHRRRTEARRRPPGSPTAAMRAPGPAPPCAIVTAAVAGDNDRLVLRSLTASDGGEGRLSASGSATLGSPDKARYEGELTLLQFTLRRGRRQHDGERSSCGTARTDAAGGRRQAPLCCDGGCR